MTATPSTPQLQLQPQRSLVRWGVALCILVGAIIINVPVQRATGGTSPFLPYFPALVLIAFFCGSRPAAAATLVAVAVVSFFWMEPVVSPTLARPQDVYALVLFLVASAIIVAVAKRVTTLVARLQQLERDNRVAVKVAWVAEERFSKAFAASPDGLVISRLDDGVILNINERFAELLGLDREHTIGRTAAEIGILGKGNVPRPGLDELRKAGRLSSQQLVLQRPGRHDIDVLVSAEILRIDEQDCILSVFRDVTGEHRALAELRTSEHRAQQLARELEESGRQKDAFLAMLAHELRNPLAPIRYAIRLLEPGTPPEMAASARQMIERQLAQMAHLLNDLLDVSRITRGTLELRLEQLDLVKVVEQAIETARPSIDAVNHSLTVSLPDHPIPVRGDPTRLAQILGNILNNAVKYTDPGGVVHVELRESGSEAQICVRDSGVGIAPELLPRIFELFSQGVRGPPAQGGLGIGLALARQLTHLHGGTLTAESEGPQRGSRFTLTLRRIAEPEAVLSRHDVKVARALFAHGANILVADDNVDAANALADVLELAGFAPHVVHDGAAAKQALERIRPHIALLDIGMPQADGHEVARWIRQQPWGRGITLIAITGWGQDADRAATRESGFDEHFTKPVDPDTLISALARALPGQSAAPAG